MRSSHSLHVPLVEIQPGESFVELDSPPHTPRTEALLQSLQPLLDASEIENLLREQDQATEGPGTPFTERSDQTGSPLWPPPSTPTHFTSDAVVANGLSPPPPRSRRPNSQRLELEKDQDRKSAARATGGSKPKRRPSAIRTVPRISIPSPAQSPSALAIEALSVYNFHLVEDASLVSMGNRDGHGRGSEMGPDTPMDVSRDERESWMMAETTSTRPSPSSPSSTHLPAFTLTHQPSYASLSDVTRNVANRSRLLLSRAPSSKSARDSVYSLVSSVDAPSTIHEPRISVSSTIYQDSIYNEPELSPSPVPTPTDEFGVMRSASSLSTAPNTFQAPTSPPCTQTLTGPHPYTQQTKSTTLSSSQLHTPVGIYPSSARPSVTTATSSAVHEPVSIRPISSDGIKQFLIPKPAIPTAPKPDFRRSRSVQPDRRLSYMSTPPSPPPLSTRPVAAPTAVHPYGPSSLNPPVPVRGSSVPPTTNMLNAQERADLIRKSRKLTQLFGQTPSPISGPGGSLSDSQVPNNMLLPVLQPRRLHARGASDFQRRTSSPDRGGLFSTLRFHSSKYEDESDGVASPLDSPDVVNTPLSVLRRESARNPVRSPTIVSGRDSFMDLSDYGVKSLRRMSSMLSLMENMTPEEKAEEERRRKREKVAKLHRYLGSRVPTELVIDAVPGTPLPPTIPVYDPSLAVSDNESPIQAKLWNRRRRNSIAGTEAFDRLPEVERRMEEMTDKERAIIVKRALKMERMFGEQPPQDLFRATRTVSGATVPPAKSEPSSPLLIKSSYLKKKPRNDDRSETSDSERRLLDTSIDSDGARSVFEGLSEVYMNYRSSLVSLAHIVDNDDRKSLAELHEYMNEEAESESTNKRESYSTISTLPERRRSLPPRASVASLYSQYSLGEPAETSSAFEQRRRRAAKLTQFFGVQYRDLFGEVLDSIENSVREDEGKGTLRTTEAQVLLVQLSKLRARKNELS